MYELTIEFIQSEKYELSNTQVLSDKLIWKIRYNLNTKEIRIENISEAYCVYKSLINDKCLCQNNQEILSVLAIQTDAFSLTIILKFFNEYTDLSKKHWQQWWYTNSWIYVLYT